jgi:hypothetical protein
MIDRFIYYIQTASFSRGAFGPAVKTRSGQESWPGRATSLPRKLGKKDTPVGAASGAETQEIFLA